MSSEDESAIPVFKKRKLQRACDYCRRKKVKCDGPRMPDNRCSRCTARRTECTYIQGHNGNYPRSYVEDLESRLERMEKLMNKICPDTDVAKEIDAHESDIGPPSMSSPTSEGSPASAAVDISALIRPSALAIAPRTPESLETDPHSDEEGDIDGEIAEGMRRLSMNSHPFRYHGRSSGMVFIRSAMALRDEYAGPRPASQGDRQHPWVTALVEEDFPIFEESSFPPRDLLDALVDLYFSRMNSVYPLLHEPTFKRSIRAGQHLRNGGFGATVLLVCAIGSRFTRDPRVFLPGSTHPHSAGWKWFRDVKRAKGLSFAPAKLYDLQVYALMALFLDETTAPQGTWTVVGAGVRAALDVGAHRKKMYSPTLNVEEELWRRAFWILVLLEWMTGFGFGRPCSIHDEDFDLALPTECDDEYWLTSDGEPLFVQPPGKPSKVSGFVYTLQLGQILASANRTIYATNKSRAQLGHADQKWEQRIVADLDSALNRWEDSLPNHLRWNPEQPNDMFLTQAATLASCHHAIQIAVHRSFISSSRRESPISLPSAIICTNAARASIQVADTLYTRTGCLTQRNTAGIIFMSATVLMMNVIELRRSGRTANLEKDLTLVGRTAEILRSLRYETHYAESLAAVLCDLMSGIAEHPPSGVSVSASAQRASDSPLSSTAIPFEGRQAEQHVDSDSPSVGRHQIPDVHGAGAGPSYASLTFAHSSSDTSSFTNPLPSNPLRPPTQGSLSVGNLATHHAAAEQRAWSPAFPLSGTYGFFPILQHDPLQAQLYDNTSADANQGAGQMPGNAGGGRMYGLSPLGTDPLMPPPLFLPSVSQVEAGVHDHRFPDAAMQLAAGGDCVDTGAPDFALMDDTLKMWSGMPATFGWNTWGTPFMNANNSGA